MRTTRRSLFAGLFALPLLAAFRRPEPTITVPVGESDILADIEFIWTNANGVGRMPPPVANEGDLFLMHDQTYFQYTGGRWLPIGETPIPVRGAA